MQLGNDALKHLPLSLWYGLSDKTDALPEEDQSHVEKFGVKDALDTLDKQTEPLKVQIMTTK